MSNFNPVDFYHLAQKIYNDAEKSDSASARTCVNRAYYSAFLAARKKGKVKNDGPGVHKNTIDYFKKRKPATTGNRLSDLFMKRKEADYELDKTITPLDAGKALGLSKAILEALGVKVDK